MIKVKYAQHCFTSSLRTWPLKASSATQSIEVSPKMLNDSKPFKLRSTWGMDSDTITSFPSFWHFSKRRQIFVVIVIFLCLPYGDMNQLLSLNLDKGNHILQVVLEYSHFTRFFWENHKSSYIFLLDQALYKTLLNPTKF